MGTYIHGVFDNDEFRRFIINQLRERKGLEPLDVVFHYFEHKNAAYNRLSDIVEEHLDMDYIMSTLGVIGEIYGTFNNLALVYKV